MRGLRSEMTQKRLLDEPKLTLEKALEVAQGIEAAVRHSQAIKGTEADVQKNYLCESRVRRSGSRVSAVVGTIMPSGNADSVRHSAAS